MDPDLGSSVYKQNHLVLQNLTLQNVKNMEYSALPELSSKMYLTQQTATFYLGAPKCIAFCRGKYAVCGTSQSLVVVFNLAQPTISYVLGDKKNIHTLGAVCSIDLTTTGESIVAGYASGELTVWDIASQSQVVTVHGYFESPVICCKFWGSDKVF